ncbi:MAG: hypothetical protein KJ625_08205, partial [Actinobacteria bacterium]|nr:hypothetical protein [Actinomycetota bacterium]
HIPTVVAFNKIDLVEPAHRAYLERAFSEGVLISTLTGEGVKELLESVSGRLPEYRTLTVTVPAARGDVISSLYRDGSVLQKEIEGGTVLMTVSLPLEKIHKYDGYLANSTNNNQ